LVIGTALIKTGNWLFLLIYTVLALTWSIMLKTPIQTLIKLLGAELILLSLMSLPLGWQKASFLMMRSLICLLIMNSFLLTVPKYHLSIALKGLPLPLKMQEIIILTAQYLEILLLEINRMQTSAKLRGLKGNSQWLRYISSAMIGSLYLRSLERAERVYNAMLIRGYNGTLPTEIQTTKQEKLLLIFTSVIAIILTLTSYKI
jgi:cobalt/nickel transport system permease protein